MTRLRFPVSAGLGLVVLLGILPLLSAAYQPDTPTAGEKRLQKLVVILKAGEDEAKVNAMQELAELGSQAEPAIPHLVPILSARNENLRLNACLTLGKIGRAAVPALKKALTDNDAGVRYYAVWGLGLVGPEAKGEAGTILKSLEDSSAEVRRKAAWALGQINPDPTPVIAALARTFRDNDPNVREAAALALAKFGVPAIPVLKNALHHKEAQVRQLALTALDKIGAAALPTLVAALNAREVDVRREAVRLLAQTHMADRSAVVGLVVALRDPDDEVRRHAVVALQNPTANVNLIASSLREALFDVDPNFATSAYAVLRNANLDPVADLRKGLQSKDEERRIAAAALLIHPKNDSFKVVPVLRQGLKNKNADWRLRAALALVFTGHSAEDAVPALLEILKTGTEAQRSQAVPVLALASLRKDAPEEAFTALLNVVGKDLSRAVRRRAVESVDLARYEHPPAKMLRVLLIASTDSDSGVRRMAATKLANASYVLLQRGFVMPREVYTAMVNRLKDEDAEVRRMAITTIFITRWVDRNTVPQFLAVMLDDPDDGVREALVTHLHQFGPAALPLYLKAVDDKSVRIRQLVVVGLQNQRVKTDKAVAALGKLLKDKDATVRGQALSALGLFRQPAVPYLVAALPESDATFRRGVLSQLKFTNGDLSGHLNALLPLLRDPDPSVRYATYDLLPRAGAPALPYLLKGLQAKDENDRGGAQAGLQHFNYKDKKALQFLMETAQKDGDPKMRTAAVSALVNAGPEQVSFVGDMIKREPNAGARQQMLQAAWGFGPAGSPLVPRFLEAFQDKSPAIRLTAVQVVVMFRSEKEKIVPALVRLLKDSDLTVRHQAIATLFILDGANVPAAVAVLENRDAHRHDQALFILSQTKVRVKEAIPLLIEALHDPFPSVRSRAARALGNQGADAKVAIPALKKAVTDSDATVRHAAEQALKQIQAQNK